MPRPGWGCRSWASAWSAGGSRWTSRGSLAGLGQTAPGAGWQLVAGAQQIGSGVLELTLSLVFVFFFYRDGPRLSAFVLRLLHRLMGERAAYYLELVAATVQRVVNGDWYRRGKRCWR